MPLPGPSYSPVPRADTVRAAVPSKSSLGGSCQRKAILGLCPAGGRPWNPLGGLWGDWGAGPGCSCKCLGHKEQGDQLLRSPHSQIFLLWIRTASERCHGDLGPQAGEDKADRNQESQIRLSCRSSRRGGPRASMNCCLPG